MRSNQEMIASARRTSPPPSSRLPVQHQWLADRGRRTSGARTQLTGVVGRLSMLMLLLTRGCCRPAPTGTCRRGDRRVVVAGRHPRTAQLWSRRRTESPCDDGVPGVALLGVLPGIAVAVAMSVLNVFRRVCGRTRPSWAGSRACRAITICGHTRMPSTAGLVMFRFERRSSSPTPGCSATSSGSSWPAEPPRGGS